MRIASGSTWIINGQLIDGTGRPAVPAAALGIQDGRILYAGPAAQAPAMAPEADRIDALGGTILPGLVEAHFHATYFNIAALEDLDIKYPVEYVSLLSSVNARLALECGYTAARSGGCLFNIDVWLKKAIEEDLVAGPRLAASGREICSAGGLMDWNPEFRKIGKDWCLSSMARKTRAKPCAPWSRMASNGSRPTRRVTLHLRILMTITPCA
jgi:imidazolonepropionase-like amidohydrolase